MKDTICVLGERRSGDLICTDFVYETGRVQESTVLQDGYVLGVVEGSAGLLLLEGEEHPLAPGDVFLVPQRTPYRLRFSGEAAYYYLVFYGRRAPELLSEIADVGTAAVFAACPEYRDILPFCRECIGKAGRRGGDLFGEAVLLYILAHIGRGAPPTEPLLSRMIEVTHEGYTSPSFSLATLARSLSYDAKYLSHYFKAQRGIGYSHYLRALRLDHAVFLMEQGLVSVKSIALLAGFSDPLYFSKIFKASRGCSPSEYIRSLGK